MICQAPKNMYVGSVISFGKSVRIRDELFEVSSHNVQGLLNYDERRTRSGYVSIVIFLTPLRVIVHYSICFIVIISSYLLFQIACGLFVVILNKIRRILNHFTNCSIDVNEK